MQKDEESTRQERADDECPAPPGELIAVTDGNQECQTDAQTPEQSCRSRVVKGVRWFRPRNAHPGIGPNLHDDRRHEKARGKDYRDNQQDKGHAAFLHGARQCLASRVSDLRHYPGRGDGWRVAGGFQ